jgi:hypothetical protein
MKFLHSRQGNDTYVIVSREDALIQPLAAAHGGMVERRIIRGISGARFTHGLPPGPSN